MSRPLKRARRRGAGEVGGNRGEFAEAADGVVVWDGGWTAGGDFGGVEPDREGEEKEDQEFLPVALVEGVAGLFEPSEDGDEDENGAGDEDEATGHGRPRWWRLGKSE